MNAGSDDQAPNGVRRYRELRDRAIERLRRRLDEQPEPSEDAAGPAATPPEEAATPPEEAATPPEEEEQHEMHATRAEDATMPTVGDHAVVVGASMAGLLAARVLADSFDRVTVLDRDALPSDPANRKGVPQGRHLHALIPSGNLVLEDLFPGLAREMADAGAATGDGLAQVRWHLSGHRLRQAPVGVDAIFMSRALLEHQVRARVQALANVELAAQTEVLGFTGRADRVDGVHVAHRADGSGEEQLAADLVVDCSGRASPTPARLAERGYESPAEEGLRLGLGYSTRNYRLPPDVLGDDCGVLIGPTADYPRAGVLFRTEHGWMVTIAGFNGDHPPSDPDGFVAWAGTLPAPDIHDAIRGGDPLDDVVTFRYPASLRRRYERLRAFPDGLLVMGDAVCSFDPIYGQGMSVAALQARVLQRQLAGGAPPEPKRFFRAIGKCVDVPWDLARCADLTVPTVPGRRTPRIRFLNAYVRRVHAAASHDPLVSAAFVRVAGLVEPPTGLFSPRIVSRVLRHGRAGKARPAPNDVGPRVATA